MKVTNSSSKAKITAYTGVSATGAIHCSCLNTNYPRIIKKITGAGNSNRRVNAMVGTGPGESSQHQVQAQRENSSAWFCYTNGFHGGKQI